MATTPGEIAHVKQDSDSMDRLRSCVLSWSERPYLDAERIARHSARIQPIALADWRLSNPPLSTCEHMGLKMKLRVLFLTAGLMIFAVAQDVDFNNLTCIAGSPITAAPACQRYLVDSCTTATAQLDQKSCECQQSILNAIFE
jgi:hypothetical protein